MKTGSKKMYFLNNFCCVCMNESDLKHIFDVDSDGISYFNKLTSSVTEMNFKDMNNQRLICAGCCVILNTVYNFRRACLRTKTNLITYISQLQRYGHVSGTLSVCLRDIKHEITIVKEEREIKCENEDESNSFEESNLQIEFKTESFEESIHFPASVKEERESEEDGNVDHVDESAHVHVKVEVEHQTMTEDEYYTEPNEIGNEEDPLADVKVEPVSDTETPRDLSTSREDTGNSVEPKTGDKTAVKTELLQKPATGSHECEICKKSLTHKSNLLRHMRIHSGVRPYECEVCKKSFSNKGNLTKHMRIHSGEKPYECEICKKSFSQKSNLTKHLLMHSGERPYECHMCDKSFIQRHNLRAHIRVHSGDRKYECNICEYKFIYKYDLTKHMLIHSGEKPYECEICKMSFNQQSSRTRHMNIHTGERQYECEICKKGFIQKTNLSRHMFKHFEENR